MINELPEWLLGATPDWKRDPTILIKQSQSNSPRGERNESSLAGTGRGGVPHRGACPAGMGGGLQMQTDLAIDPAGNVWVMDNWQDINSCYGNPPEGLSTRRGGQGVTIFYGMAKPVRAPQIGPARQP